MPWKLVSLQLLAPAFLLVLFRIGGLFIAAPILSSAVIPRRYRIAMALALSAMVFPMVLPAVPGDLTVPAAVVGVLGELMVGLVIGFGLTLFLLAFQLTGTIIGQQAGIGLATVFNPAQGGRSSVTGQVFFLTAITVFLIAGGHRSLVAAMLDTFTVFPPLSFGISETVVQLLAELLTAAFAFGLRLAAPVLIALFLSALAMGFLSRTMPQLNILSVGFNVRVLVSLLMAGLALWFSRGTILDGLTKAMDLIRGGLGIGAGRW